MSTSRRVTRWYCETCSKGFWKHEQADRHEPHCYRRDDRVPWPGELSSIRATGRNSFEDYGAWVSHTPPVWWPGAGKLWTGAQWVDVAGYRCSRNETGAGPEEVWPDAWGIPLNQHQGEVRLDWWIRTTEGAPTP